jgi:hypothetical protein
VSVLWGTAMSVGPATKHLEKLRAAAKSAGVRDLTRQCWCTCHIGWHKLQRLGRSEIDAHLADVTQRIQCTVDGVTKDPDSNQLCIVCGRMGKDRYLPIPDLTGVNLNMLAESQRRKGVITRGVPDLITEQLIKEGKAAKERQ